MAVVFFSWIQFIIRSSLGECDKKEKMAGFPFQRETETLGIGDKGMVCLDMERWASVLRSTRHYSLWVRLAEEA